MIQPVLRWGFTQVQDHRPYFSPPRMPQATAIYSNVTYLVFSTSIILTATVEEGDIPTFFVQDQS